MSIRKRIPLLSLITSLIILTFLWSQVLWAGGFSLYAAPSTEKNLPNNIQEKSPKESRILDIIGGAEKSVTSQTDTTHNSLSPSAEKCTAEIQKLAFLANPTPQIPPQIYPLGGQTDRLGRVDQKYGTYDGDSYKWEAISYDELGRPTAYKEKYGKVSSKHYDIIYNELGDVAYEKIKVSAKQGYGIFASKTTVVTEYKYGYDKYGQHEKIWENEIYRKVSTNPIGTIVKVIVAIVIAAIPGLNIIATAALMAASNFIFALLSGASLKDALIGAAISFAASMLGSFLGGADFTSVSQGLTGLDIFFQALSLADSLMVDDQGKGLFEQMFGKWGSVVFDVISVLVAFKTSKGTTGPPYQLYAALGRLAVSATLTALGDRIDPRLRQFISAFTTSFLNAWANAMTEKAKIKQAIDQGSNNTQDKKIKEVKPITRTDTTTGKETTVGSIVTFDDGSQAQLDRNGVPLWYQDNTEGKTYFYGLDGALLGSLPKGWTALTDSSGNHAIKYLVPRADGNFDVYDLSIQKEGVLPSGATPQFDSNGNFIGSTNESVFGTRYYGTNGQEQAWIPEGYTPIQNENGEITGSYKNFDYGATEYRDNDGKFQYWTRQGKDGEIYIHDGSTVTNLRADGTTNWTKQNIPFSTINYYDADGQKVIAQLSTKLDENGFIQNKIYHNLATDEFTYYDRDGNNLGTYQARRDSEGNIYAYKTTDANGTQIIVDKDLNIRSSLTKDGEYRVYKNGELYRVTRRESVAIVSAGVLDQDSITGKFTLYNDLGEFITDDPTKILQNLNNSLAIWTMPEEIVKELRAEALEFLDAKYDRLMKESMGESDKDKLWYERLADWANARVLKAKAELINNTTNNWDIALATVAGTLMDIGLVALETPSALNDLMAKTGEIIKGGLQPTPERILRWTGRVISEVGYKVFGKVFSITGTVLEPSGTGKVAGIVVGGTFGAGVGGITGTLTLPGVGTSIGAVIGGIFGGLVGGIVGSWFDSPYSGNLY